MYIQTTGNYIIKLSDKSVLHIQEIMVQEVNKQEWKIYSMEYTYIFQMYSLLVCIAHWS